MNGKTVKLLKDFYATFYYRDPRVFQSNWKAIKKQWDSLPVPERNKASARMRAMLKRYAEATKKAQRAMPNLKAIQEASTLLQEKGLPTGEIPSADEPQGWGQGDAPDGPNSDRDDIGGA